MYKFAILTDSGTDTPIEYITDSPTYVVPLSIIFKDGAFMDNVDITPDEVVQRFSEEIPKTSLPTVGQIEDKISEIKSTGFCEVMVVTISSGLSGTHNAIKIAAQSFSDMRFVFVDTKNIGIGSGMVTAYAVTLAKSGFSLEEATPKVQEIVGNTKVYFCIPTLSFLRKGGRIGLVAGFVGEALGLRPIITCNTDGIYETIRKVRGWRKAVDAALEQAVAFHSGVSKYNVAVAHSNTAKEAISILENLKLRLPGFKQAFFSTISPALTVHTGPGLIGVGLQRLPD